MSQIYLKMAGHSEISAGTEVMSYSKLATLVQAAYDIPIQLYNACYDDPACMRMVVQPTFKVSIRSEQDMVDLKKTMQDCQCHITITIQPKDLKTIDVALEDYLWFMALKHSQYKPIKYSHKHQRCAICSKIVKTEKFTSHMKKYHPNISKFIEYVIYNLLLKNF